MIRRGREKRHPAGMAPEEPILFSSKSAHLEFNPEWMQLNTLGIKFQNSPMQLENESALTKFNLSRLGANPGFFINFWVWYNNTGVNQFIIGKTDGLVSGLFDYDLWISATGVINFQTYTTGGAVQTAFATAALPVGTKTMVTLNCTQTNPNRFGVDIFLDTVLRGSYSFNGARRVDNAPMTVGANALASANFLNSTIDQFFLRKQRNVGTGPANIMTTLYNSGSGLNWEQFRSSDAFKDDKQNVCYWKNVDSSGTFIPDRIGEGTSLVNPAGLSQATIEPGIASENFFTFPNNPVPNNGYFTSGPELFSEKDDVSKLRESDVFVGGEVRQTVITKVPVTYYGNIPGMTKSNAGAPSICYFDGTDVHYRTTTDALDVLQDKSKADIFITLSARAFNDQDVFTITTGTGAERFTYSLTSSGKHEIYLRQQDSEPTPQQYQFAIDYDISELFIVRAKIDYTGGVISLEVNGKPAGDFSLLSSLKTDNTNSTLIKIGSGLVLGSQQLSIARISCFIDELSTSEVQNYYKFIKGTYDVPCY